MCRLEQGERGAEDYERRALVRGSILQRNDDASAGGMIGLRTSRVEN